VYGSSTSGFYQFQVSADQSPKKGAPTLVVNSPAGATQAIIVVGIQTSSEMGTFSASEMCASVEITYVTAGTTIGTSYAAGSQGLTGCTAAGAMQIGSLSLDITSATPAAASSSIASAYIIHGTLTGTADEFECGPAGCDPMGGTADFDITF
jgi:hypothetical protein